jgi:flavin reductase (DIM6/NTAB) family NADH-FMN oxidoreductase RutF
LTVPLFVLVKMNFYESIRPMTEVNFDDITSYERYKLMASLIVPRPIALVTSLGANGVVNAAPFSMFNMIGEDPPILMISINRLQDGQLKDTAANILHNGEFVVHMSDEPIAKKMHDCGKNFPSNISELAEVGFTPVPSRTVKPPRIAEAPIAFECVLHEKLETPSRYVFIGRIQWLAARDGLIDTQAWRVNLKDYRPVARFGASFYTRTDDRFAISDKEGDRPQNNTPIDQI